MLTEYLNDVISIKRGELIGFSLVILSISIAILLLMLNSKKSKQFKNIIFDIMAFLITFELIHIIYYFYYL